MSTDKKNLFGAITLLIVVLIVTISLIYAIGIIFDLIKVHFHLPISSSYEIH